MRNRRSRVVVTTRRAVPRSAEATPIRRAIGRRQPCPTRTRDGRRHRAHLGARPRPGRKHAAAGPHPHEQPRRGRTADRAGRAQRQDGDRGSQGGRDLGPALPRAIGAAQSVEGDAELGGGVQARDLQADGRAPGVGGGGARCRRWWRQVPAMVEHRPRGRASVAALPPTDTTVPGHRPPVGQGVVERRQGRAAEGSCRAGRNWAVRAWSVASVRRRTEHVAVERESGSSVPPDGHSATRVRPTRGTVCTAIRGSVRGPARSRCRALDGLGGRCPAAAKVPRRSPASGHRARHGGESSGGCSTTTGRSKRLPAMPGAAGNRTARCCRHDAAGVLRHGFGPRLSPTPESPDVRPA